jgi:LPXTG-site transpeptidase (sortase) family protein
VNENNWRRRLSDTLLCSGGLILLGVFLFWLQYNLASRQMYDWRYLVSNSSGELPAPALPPIPTPMSISVLVPQTTPTASEEAAAQASLIPQEIGIPQTPPAQIETEIPQVSPQSTSDGQVIQDSSAPLVIGLAFPIVMNNELPTPTPRPDTGRVVRLVIPRLKIDRAVVMVGLSRDVKGRLQWDTDRLFATRNRLDLVGQLDNSLNPGRGGNVVLVGHNYDNGVYVWEGVFINLKNIQPGDQLIVYTEGGGEYRYIVQQLKKVPWTAQNDDEMQKHMKYMGPSETERLTLMTCSGANIWPWPARLYVVAEPVQAAAQ